ncbi:MAG: hypothetical protein ACLS4Z_09355 [Christensenellaceae bacterium]
MTYAMREEIFSKEYLSIEDIQELLGLHYADVKVAKNRWYVILKCAEKAL